MSIAMKTDLWDLWERSQGAIAYAPEPEEPAQQDTSESFGEPSLQASEKESSPTESKQNHGELRHSRRRQIRSSAEIVDWHSVLVKPDIARVVDASSDGILFDTDREYPLGMELLVRFPYPSSSSPKQRGTVVRVEEQPDGHWWVAVRFG